MKIETIYGLEWEYKALQETKNRISKSWKNSAEAFNESTLVSNQIDIYLKKNNIGFVPLPFEFRDKEHSDLFIKILEDLISFDPFLFRIYLYCRIPPQYLESRMFLKEHYYRPADIGEMDCWYYFHKLDVLENSELTKSILYKDKPVKNVPLHYFITGKVINYLFLTYNHYSTIDLVKQGGVKETIEELRKNRIYESNKGIVYDYSPLWKHIDLKNSNDDIFEFFSQEDFDVFVEGMSYMQDQLLCDFIQKPEPDPRPHFYFGNDSEVSDVYTIVRFGTTEKKIPCQLLPRYKNLIKKMAKKYTLTNLKTDKGGLNKEEETQEATFGFFNAAKSVKCGDSTFANMQIGAIPYWLEHKTKWHLGEAFDKVSANDPKTDVVEGEPEKRKLIERIESEGGRLDEQIPNKASDENNEDYITKKKDFVEDENDFLEKVDDRDESDARKKLIEKDPKMKAIFKKKTEDNSLTPAERKYKERFKKKNKR